MTTPHSHWRPGAPERWRALRQYSRRAPIYDAQLFFAEPIRFFAVARLDLFPGDEVLDVGCGTGLSLPMLERRLGARGRIIAIEQSPDMIARAEQRASRAGWRNVTFLQAPVEQASIPGEADAALFNFTHDILRNEAALENVFAHLRPGARVVATGLKWAPPWALARNAMVLIAALNSVTTLDGLDEPWSLLARFVRPMRVETLPAGAIFLASGRARATPAYRGPASEPG